MTKKKISPAQIALLRSVALGKVWRDDFGSRYSPLYTWYVQSEARKVTRTFKALHDAGLVDIDFAIRHRPVAVLTEAGRSTLDAIKAELT
jgi:hypothetical protein